jgi:SDR family mycofactocin-dependent oxidoreductase
MTNDSEYEPVVTDDLTNRRPDDRAGRVAGSRVAGKVALITGAARGQGRSHAVRLAEEGADIIAIDICADIPSIEYPMGTADELAETGRQVEAAGRRVVTATADVRDPVGLTAAINAGVSQLGRLDIAVANAGICTIQPWNQVDPQVWNDIIAINLTGVWHTCSAAAPHLIAAGGGSLILISSTAGLKGQPFVAPYAAAKHGVVGVMHVLTNELAEYGVRVNSVHPTGVRTPMLAGLTAMPELVKANPLLAPILMNSLPFDLLEPEDVSDTVLFLASDESRYVTGLTMTVDGGASAR